ncbi:astacin [Oesophagostomum dentatum]|uniref:Metalloendopeptidase n=1 Tax=Oesophagostomum dentatum TaxID=61180 RepID=A0A0B1TFC1_OESDE|nr:astacin [Oesophagostomum dentatum]
MKLANLGQFMKRQEIIVNSFVCAGNLKVYFDLASDEHQLLYEQMDKIAKNTCVKFRERNDEEDYVAIVNGLGEGCNSAVGRPGGESVISLESSKFGSCFDRGTLMRFLLHTVGLYGEQMREDRDKYIRVHDENIIDGYEHFFTKILDASSYRVPYDYLSIMHYGKNEYAKPGTITIETLDDRFQDLIGKQTEPTGNDYVKVCLMYNCKTCMGTETLVL